MLKGDKTKHVDRRPAVIWDVADMTTLYGAVFGIEVLRGELSLLFAARSVRRGTREEAVMVSNRIILHPFTAKRLLVLLRKTMARHQLPFGMDSNDLRAFMETKN